MRLFGKRINDNIDITSFLNKKNSIIYKIDTFIYHYYKTPLRITKNLIRWFPVIVKDRDWDQSYIYNILKTKLKHQAEYIFKRDFHTMAKYDSSRIYLCTKLIDKLQTEFYSSEYMEYNETTFDFVKSEERPEYFELKSDEVRENYDDYFAKHRAAVRRVLANPKLQIFKLTTGEDGYKRRLAINVSYYNHNRARKILFTIMERDIESWWD